MHPPKDSFLSLLELSVEESSSLLCVGLDAHADDLPTRTADGARDFCLRIVEQTAPFAAAFKPNSAFFEAFGEDGWRALRAVLAGIREESQRLGRQALPIILDAKRGDIASTAEAYATAVFETLGADAVTLSPYLGRDSIEPFVRDARRGVFLLCKTSNLGSGDLQDVAVAVDGGSSIPLYLHVAQLAAAWNTAGNIGLVVGATFPETLAGIRQAAPDLWFLSPGVGAQGGELEAALRAGLRHDGRGVLINASRSIARSADAGKAARELRDRIAAVQGTLRAS
jgi:uridine monophosphate synthetase